MRLAASNVKSVADAPAAAAVVWCSGLISGVFSWVELSDDEHESSPGETSSSQSLLFMLMLSEVPCGIKPKREMEKRKGT